MNDVQKGVLALLLANDNAFVVHAEKALNAATAASAYLALEGGDAGGARNLVRLFPQGRPLKDDFFRALLRELVRIGFATEETIPRGRASIVLFRLTETGRRVAEPHLSSIPEDQQRAAEAALRTAKQRAMSFGRQRRSLRRRAYQRPQ